MDDEKLLRIFEEILEIKGDLREHMRRTEAAEDNLELLRQELKPIKVHVGHVEGALKMLGMLAIGAGVVVSILQFIF
jgi:hypothetical protein